MTANDIDPGGLIREAYAIEGISVAECRSIFLDWAIKLPAGSDPAVAILRLLAIFEATAPADHPMTQILRAGLDQSRGATRRGGARARRN